MVQDAFRMKVGVVGLGYVGLVTAAVLAENGNSIIGIEIDKEKLRILKSGKSPIFEPGLEETLNRFRERLHYSENYNDLADCSIVYVTVPTPNRNEKIDLSYVMDAVGKILDGNRNTVIAIKSTVLPGTAAAIFKKFSVSVVSNPEFTREGNAMDDTRKPDRIVIGCTDQKKSEKIRDLWAFTGSPFVLTSNENAELIKYASNAFLATKISFINEIANLCEKIPNSDVNTIAEGMGYDRRIAPYFLRAGIGYGGSCFPKDTQALISFARDLGDRLSVVEAAVDVNDKRVPHVADLIRRTIGSDLRGKKVGILGLSFKDNTDDVRESPAIKLIRILEEEGAIIFAYNPVPVRVELKMPVNTGNLKLLKDLDIIVVASEWPEFRSIEKLNLKIPVVDAKRILEPQAIPNYAGIGLYGR
jgi:UDPglucose 6-dehydrogenase